MIKIFSVLKQGVSGFVTFFTSDTTKITSDNDELTSDID